MLKDKADLNKWKYMFMGGETILLKSQKHLKRFTNSMQSPTFQQPFVQKWKSL